MSVSRLVRGWAVGVPAAVLLAYGPAGAQQPATAKPDTVPVYSLDKIVVTADRAEGSLGSTVAATTAVSLPEFERLPSANVGDALRLVPGVALVDFDGQGLEPQIMSRGFYGGGEAEYMVVLRDGRPVNELTNGLMRWEIIPPVTFEAMEVVRGSFSPLYGDAALGGVINIMSASPVVKDTRWDLSAGEFGTMRVGVRQNRWLGTKDAQVYAGALHTDGYRNNAKRNAFAAGGSVDIVPNGGLRLWSDWTLRDADDPGALPDSLAQINWQYSVPFHRFDGDAEWAYRLGLDGSTGLGGATSLSGGITGDVRRTDAWHTLPRSASIWETQRRLLETNRVSGNVQLEHEGLGLPWNDRLIVGGDASVGRTDSRYKDVTSGDLIFYSLTGANRDTVVAKGSGTRNMAAGYAEYDVLPTDAVRLSVGARIDWIHDSFEPEFPSTGAASSSDHTAFSPRAGLNVRWLESERQTGNVYVTASKSFKAATPDQLYDQRRVPAPIPPFGFRISNALLDPQRGTSVEAGLYHSVSLVPDSWVGGLSAAVYQIDMTDEIDFDIATFKYVNLGTSRHRGVEAGARLAGPRESSLFVNYTLQSPTSQGKALKAIPRHFITAGLAGEIVTGFEGGLYLTRQSGVWLDDANTVPLAAYTRVDARLSMPVSIAVLSVEVRNLFDSRYSTTGFLDPLGTGTVFLRTAAKRTFQVGMRVTT